MLEQLLQTIILGLIQGITEWLPISSTGHLQLAEQLLHMNVPILFDVILHVGTLAVVFAFFRNDIKNVLSALARRDFKSENGKLVPLMIVGTIPTALIGVFLGDQIEATFQNLLPLAGAFLVSGVILYASKMGKEETDEIGYATALLIGTAQGIAITPGISRSGATIAVALLLGVKRQKAFQFSFLLSIPAILGALGLTFYKQSGELAMADVGLAEIAVGMVVAMVVGYFALKLLKGILTRRKFHYFALYCWLLGVALLAFGLYGA